MVKPGKFVSSPESPYLIEEAFMVLPFNSNWDQVVLNFHKKNSSIFSIEFGRCQKLTLSEIFNERIASNLQSSKVSIGARPGQLLEPYTVFGEYELSSTKENFEIVKAKYSSRHKLQEVMMVTKNHLRKLYLDEYTCKNTTNNFLFAGDQLGHNLILTIGGKIIQNQGSNIVFRVGKPYLFTEGAKIYKNHQDFAPKNTLLGFVSYKIFKVSRYYSRIT